MAKSFIDEIEYRLVTTRIKKDYRPSGDALLDDFKVLCGALSAPRVLELGTRRSMANRSTRHDSWVPQAAEYLGTDIEAGADVDVVADVHRLSHALGEEMFDVVISCSTFEHFKYPHLAAHEIMKTLRIGGLVFLQTHQSLPLHGYPFDYFRFSREGLAGLFGTKMGFEVLATDYEFPVKLFSPNDPYAVENVAYLNVRLLGKKNAKTPVEYVYEFDTELAQSDDKKR